MAIFYDGNGSPVDIGGGGDSKFGVSDYLAFADGSGTPAREATLTYEGRKLYPNNYTKQRKTLQKKYSSGVMIALGDSYTAMGSSYYADFAKQHGLVADNRGLASSTIAGSPGANAQPGEVGYHPFWERLDQAVAEYKAGHDIDGTVYHPEDVKLVVFMGGANDWYTVTESINRLGDPTSTDKEQLWGASKYIFNALLTTFQNADIVVILQPNNAAHEADEYPMWAKEDIVRDAAHMYGLPICDCCFDWYSPANPAELTKYWQSDKLHLTADGYHALFEKLENTLNSLQLIRGGA